MNFNIATDEGLKPSNHVLSFVPLRRK